MECLCYCFHQLLQAELDFVKDHWNTHLIRKSCHDTVYFVPQLHGFLFQVPGTQVEFGLERVVALKMDTRNTLIMVGTACPCLCLMIGKKALKCSRTLNILLYENIWFSMICGSM